MTKGHSIKINILLSSVFVFSVFLFLFSGRSIFAMDVSPIDLWRWEENLDDKGNLVSLSLMEYLSDEQANCENIIIPNLCDFKQKDTNRYKNLEKVFISKAVMNSVAKKASQYNGCLKISDTMNGNIIAFDEDWSNCFNFENNNIKEIDLSRLDTTNITNMASMFSGCKTLTKLDLFGFDTENVEDMSNMFINTGLKIIDLSSFMFNYGVNTEKMFDEVSENRLLVLSNEQNYDVLTELTENRDAMNLKFIFGEENFFAFDGVVFCPSSIVSRETDENFDDYLNKIIEKCSDIIEQRIKEKGLCSEECVISWQSETDYNTVEEKLNGIYRGTAELPSDKLELIEGKDFKWPEAIKDLKYDGQSKELINNGFISEDIKNSGIRFEYSLDKTNWNDKIPTGTEIGVYKIYMRINGGEKYQDVYFVDKNGNDYLRVEIIKTEEEIKKLALIEGKDFRWPEAIKDLKYDGQSKKLIGHGFISENIKDSGVKFECSLDKTNWSDQIPTGTDIGVYKICMRVNGGEKYQDVYFVDKNGNNYLRVEIIKAEEEIKKLELIEGKDFRWSEAIKDLKYDGQSKELINNGFISEDIKNSGVKFEYSLDKTNWSDQIPTGTDIGVYKICMRVNGGEKYQDVYFVDENGNDYLKVKIYALELQDGIDYKFAQARTDLIYNGRMQELLYGGYVNENIKNDGVKIQYSNDGIRWSDKMPTERKAGVYRIYQKVNGGKKYKDVFYNVYGKRYVEVKISNSKKKSDAISWRTIESDPGNSAESNRINTNNPEFKKVKSDKTLKQINLPERFKIQKYLSGYPDGQIKPWNNMTHAEFVNMIYKLMYDGKEKINTEKIKDLTDVKISDWYGVGVAYLLDKDIISIENNSFKPNENITRGEVAEIWFNVLKFYDTEKSKKYDYGDTFYKFADSDKFGKFAEPIKQLASNGIINGYEDKTFKADKNITRAEAAKIIFYASGRKNNLGQKIYSDLGKNYWAYKFLMDASV